MAQERITAKNTFGEGLIMDFAPDVTQASTLTNALNATLLTFNGNESSLQNDMGNCRVESAYLPQGYIPVGTCEFGDIIYIVSYNPLENRSQIGCFPSPERNITNTEISPIKTTISKDELLHVQGDTITGNPSIKKIIFGNKNINTGDKFVISWEETGTNNFDYISNYGNTNHNLNTEAYWPKLTKIHVVAIEDSGKIVYLDNDVKWYTPGNENHDFIISEHTFNLDSTAANLDTYRSALQCQYSVFQEKTAGKLALLLELESINSFSSGYKVIPKIGKNAQGKQSKYYDVYLSTYWDTDNFNINPCGFLITSSSFIKLIPCSLDSSGILQDARSQENKFIITHKYDVNRMVEYSRLYKLEDQPDSYADFLKISYYNQINDLNSFVNLSRAYVYNKEDNSYIPQVNDSGNAMYVENAAKVEYETSANSVNIVYKNIFGESITPIEITDDVIVNTYKRSVLKKVGSFRIPEGITGDSVPTLNFKVCPCMPYGPLEQFEQEHTIIFKDDQQEPELNTWKYYVNNTSVTLNFGINSHLGMDTTKAVGKVVMEFYDNIGLCASYLLENQESYDSQFTEYLNLDSVSTNFKIKNINLVDNIGTPILHPSPTEGLTATDVFNDGTYDSYIYKVGNNYKKVESQGTQPVFLNDAGVLYYGRPYLVKIYIYKGTVIPGLNEISYDPKDAPKPILRWLWTAPVFNDYYTSSADFNNVRLDCKLDLCGSLDGRNLQKEGVIQSAVYNDLSNVNFENFAHYKTLGAQVKTINLDKSIPTEPVIFTGYPKLADQYLDSILFCGGTDSNLQYLNDIDISVGVDSKEIITSDCEVIYSDNSKGDSPELMPVTSTDLQETLANLGDNLINLLNINTQKKQKPELYSTPSDYQNYKDSFNLEITSKSLPVAKTTKITYTDSQGKISKEKELQMYTWNAKDWLDGKVELLLKGIQFSKIKATRMSRSLIKELYPLIYSEEDLNKFGLGLNKYNRAYFKNIMYIGINESGGGHAKLATGILDYEKSESTGHIAPIYESIKHNIDLDNGNNSAGSENINKKFSDIYKYFQGKTQQQPFWQIVWGRSYKSDANDESYKGYALEYPILGVLRSQGIEDFDGKLLTDPNSTYQSSSLPQIRYRTSIGFGGGNDGFIETDPKKRNLTNNNDLARNLFTCLALNINGELWPTGDIGFLNNKGKYYNPENPLQIEAPKIGNIYQEFEWNSETQYAQYRPSVLAYSYAQLLASLLCQIYSLRDSEKEISKIEDRAQLNDYQEAWKANIVVRFIVKNSDYDNLQNNSTSRFLKITPGLKSGDNTYGYELRSYVDSILKGAGYTPTDNKFTTNLGNGVTISFSNINPSFSETTKCIEFNYTVPYDIKDIKAQYNSSSLSSIGVNVGTLLNNQLHKSRYVLLENASVNEGALYSYTPEGGVSPFTDHSIINYVDKFIKPDSAPNTILGVVDSAKQNINQIQLYESGIHKALHVSSNGSIQIKSYEQLNFYDNTLFIKHLSKDYFTIGGLHSTAIFNYLNYD